MRIQKQIGLGFLGVVVASGLATAIAFTGQGYLLRVSEAVGEEAKLHASATALERAVTKLVEGASAVVRADDPTGRQVAAEGRAELAASIAALDRLTLDRSMAAELDELKVLAGAAAAANSGVLAIVGTVGAGDARAAERLARTMGALETRRRALILKVHLFSDHARARTQAAQVATRQLWQRGRLHTAATFVVALALALALSLILAHRIARPIELLAAAARQVGAGDFCVRTGVQRLDEVGDLAVTFDRMANDLQAAQASLIRAERLAAIGELAVTMRHELNNPLAGISGAVAVLLDDRFRVPDAAREALMMVQDAAARMSAVLRKLDRISEPVSKTYVGNIRMLDLDRSTM